MITCKRDDTVAPALGEAQQNPVRRSRVQVLQYGAHGFVTFLKQYLGNIKWRTPLRLKDQVIELLLGNGGDWLNHRIFLIL